MTQWLNQNGCLSFGFRPDGAVGSLAQPSNVVSSQPVFLGPGPGRRVSIQPCQATGGPHPKRSFPVTQDTPDQIGREALTRAGVSSPAEFDLWTAIVSGLASQQSANDPGGDRWRRLIDRAVDMFADHVLAPHQARSRR